MFVQNLHIYPVKSFAGIAINEGKILQRGFQFDRRWMLVDNHNKFITQRKEHRLALLKTAITETGIEISDNKTARSIIIPFTISSGEICEVTIWDDLTRAIHYRIEADKWFSEFLDQDCKLVHFPENGVRPVDERYARQQENVSFADAFPYLLISQASLDDLNSRLAQTVPMNRFRPNIVISDTVPFEEDSWDEIKIGEVRFKVAKPCARCILTTVDQLTAIKGKEPLATLSSYRSINNKVLFGQNLIALNEGEIRIDDQVDVIRYKQ